MHEQEESRTEPAAPEAYGGEAFPVREPAVRPPAGSIHPVVRKRPGLAAFLSILPGLGHVYCGLYPRALVFFAAFAGSIQLIDSVGSPVFGLSLVFFWSFGLVDAYRQATLMNLGYAADSGVVQPPRTGKPGQEILITGIVLFSLGFLELLSRIGLWNWDLMAEHAYFLLMVVGGWLIVSAVISRRKAARNDLSEALQDL